MQNVSRESGHFTSRVFLLRPHKRPFLDSSPPLLSRKWHPYPLVPRPGCDEQAAPGRRPGHDKAGVPRCPSLLPCPLPWRPPAAGKPASSARSPQKRIKVAETLQCCHKFYTGFLRGVCLSQFLSPSNKPAPHFSRLQPTRRRKWDGARTQPGGRAENGPEAGDTG